MQVRRPLSLCCSRAVITHARMSYQSAHLHGISQRCQACHVVGFLSESVEGSRIIRALRYVINVLGSRLSYRPECTQVRIDGVLGRCSEFKDALGARPSPACRCGSQDQPCSGFHDLAVAASPAIVALDDIRAHQTNLAIRRDAGTLEAEPREIALFDSTAHH